VIRFVLPTKQRLNIPKTVTVKENCVSNKIQTIFALNCLKVLAFLIEIIQ
jgi:hypothetical protein